MRACAFNEREREMERKACNNKVYGRSRTRYKKQNNNNNNNSSDNYRAPVAGKTITPDDLSALSVPGGGGPALTENLVETTNRTPPFDAYAVAASYLCTRAHTILTICKYPYAFIVVSGKIYMALLSLRSRSQRPGDVLQWCVCVCVWYT